MHLINIVGEEYLEKLTPQEREELVAVFYFFRNKKLDEFKKEKIILKPDEPSDIIYDLEKFQITTAPKQISEVIGKLDKNEKIKIGRTEGSWINLSNNKKTKMWGTDFNIEESFYFLVIEPIENKYNQYGGGKFTSEAIRDITLLIYCNNMPLIEWNDSIWINFIKKYTIFFNKTGFKEIYLIDQKLNIKIYP